MTGMARLLTVLACVLFAPGGAGAQDAPDPAPELVRDVEAWLAEPDEDVARKGLEELLARPDADGPRILAALRSRPREVLQAFRLMVPHAGLNLAVEVQVPEGHGANDLPLPVVLDISGGGVLQTAPLPGVITVAIPGYTPPQFSHEGRDGFLKALRLAAFAANGDPERLWLTGFSWAGHACYDVALHRPGVLRGILPAGGGPRHVWFRILRNIQGVKVRAFVGEQDDPILVWNLHEVDRIAGELELDHQATFVPEAGHVLPLSGMETNAPTMLAAGTRPPPIEKGTLFVDEALVGLPWLRVDVVDERRVAVPKRITLRPGMSEDAQRRALLGAMEKAVARVRWTLVRSEHGLRIDLVPDGTRSATVFLRDDMLPPGTPVEIRWKGRSKFKGPAAPDPRVLLEEARRTGDRFHPAYARISLGP